ncbi:deoxyribose-phosphate aldolase [Proteiniborus ethanoligenes]|uniref:Deoxyribose-phosphate aldolase n=1 Tax=Proteiniborus ethanoligenes TaxID=415015 RepID=A0A1H3PZF2_9FIRM|nr:deoxyribose-phosphate aldolase [Proteiniborus ethanoligenes]TAH63962.1 MAG: deoxyribose-phosphate aldolase [Gottschalkiaceae bacterium]SDZ05789.1 deoxyribose-phosphate aldolase [Proteiniborus ethanoligenes]
MNNLASMIDHTILKPEITKEMVKKVCEEAREYKFASVCVNPYYVNFVKSQLEGSGVKVTSVIGFPLGSTNKEVKAFEAKNAIENGADELDMVINVGALKDKEYDIVREDIKAVVEAAKGRALVKVIIETCLLTDEEKEIACKLAVEAGADYVKTSTGFNTGGATKEDIILMRESVGPQIGVKASGGIRDSEKAKEMIEAGATRIGASSSVEIVEGIKAADGSY